MAIMKVKREKSYDSCYMHNLTGKSPTISNMMSGIYGISSGTYNLMRQLGNLSGG